MKNVWLILLLLFTTGVSAVQSQITVKGIVKDTQNVPIIGATIQVKGTDKGTITGVDGYYQLEKVKIGDTLVVSYVGFETFIVQVKKEKHNIILREQSHEIGEVVAIGYATQRRVTLTGAVDNIQGEQLVKTPSTSTAVALQGRLSGVFVNSPSSSPGGDSNTQILIRGVGTLNDSSPLILIDGIESTSSNFLSLNVNDIESISVLKDAASAAIYGNRAANGVLLVTTKKGNSHSKTNISYNVNYGVHKPVNIPKLMNSWDFLEWQNKGQIKNDKPLIADEETIAKYRSGEDPYLYPNYQPYDIFLREGQETSHNLSIRGGQNKLSYYLSANYKSQDGVEIGNDYRQLSLRGNLEASFLKDKLKINVIQQYVKSKSNLPATNINTKTGKINRSSILGTAIKQSPKTKVLNPDGTFADANYALYFSGGYAVLNKQQNQIKLSTKYTLNSNIAFEFEYANSVTRNEDIGVIPDYVVVTNWETKPKENLYNSQLVQYQSYLGYSNVNALLRSQWSLNQHHIQVLMGASSESWNEKWNSVNGSELIDISVPSINNIVGSTVLDAFSSTKVMLSGFGRFNYNYLERYLLEATIRLDGSSIFYRGNRWGAFPSISVGWRLSEEPFLRDNHYLRNLKLRLSYGQLGNDRCTIYSIYNTVANNNKYALNQNAINGVSVSNVGNRDLTWERSSDFNVGVDLQLGNNFIAYIDYFDKRTTDILQKITAPLLFGYKGTGIMSNYASMRNYGIDSSLEFKHYSRSFKWAAKLNLEFVKNEVTKFNSGDTGLDYEERNKGWNIIKKGEPYMALYGYEVAGIISTDDMENKLNKIYKGTIPSEGYATTGIESLGDWYYVDKNRDGKIDNHDKTVLGSPYPKLFGGLNLSMAYKGFDLTIFFQGAFGGKVFSNGTLVDPYMSGSAKVMDLVNIWTPENTKSTIPWSDGNKSKITPNSYYVEDASYLRLKNVALGYSIPKKYLKKIHINSLKITASINNLYTFTRFRYFDPEVALESTNNDFNYPQTQFWNIGLQLDF